VPTFEGRPEKIDEKVASSGGKIAGVSYEIALGYKFKQL
jgi:hypothetical protein